MFGLIRCEQYNIKKIIFWAGCGILLQSQHPRAKVGKLLWFFFFVCGWGGAGGQPRLHSIGKVELNTVGDAALQQDFAGFFNASGYSSRTE